MRRRRWLLIGGAALALLACAFVFLFVIYGAVGAWMIRSKVLPKIERKLGRDVVIGDVEVRRGHAVLKNVVVRGPKSAPDQGLVRIERVEIDFAFWPSLFGEAEVSRARLDGLRVTARRDREGDNFSDVIDRLGRRGEDKDGASSGSGLGSMRPGVVEVSRGSFELQDRRAGVTILGTGISGGAEAGGQLHLELGDVAALSEYGPHARAQDVTITAEASAPRATAKVAVAGGEVFLWRGMTLTGVRGSASQGDQPGKFVIDFAGGYGGAQGELWAAEGWIEPDSARGSLTIKADRFTFDRIGSVLANTMVRDFQDTSVDASLNLDLDKGHLRYRGGVDLRGLSIFHPMLSAETVRDVTLTGEVAGSYDQRTRVLRLDKAEMTTRGVGYSLSGKVALAGGVEDDDQIRLYRRFDARLAIPPVPCQTMLESIPGELVPHLVGFKLKGKFATDVEVAVDWADLEATVLDGQVGIRGCKVAKAPEEMDARRLLEDFDHEVEMAPDVWETIRISPDNLSFTPLSSVSVHLLNSFMTTEDSAFYRHHGYITREFRTALIKNLEAGYFKYGASSITMQLVKNVLLHRDKTLARKLQELFLAWYIETKVDKDRLFEIYVNAIEYGPGLYGIKPATYQYFDKHPADLNPVEAAFFSTLLPKPKQRYKQFCTDKVFRSTQTKIQRILGLMHSRGRLTAEELAEAVETPLIFQPDKSGFCTKKYPEWGIR